MNEGMSLTSFLINEPEEDFYIYHPGWLNVWESHLYNQSLKATGKRGWSFKRFGTTKEVYAREMVRKPDYINYIEALEQAADGALQKLSVKERMQLLKSRTAFLYVDAWGESASFENITSALHIATIDTLPKNLLKKFSVKDVSCKIRGERMSLIAAMQLAQDYLHWNVFDFVVICAAYRAIPLLVFSEEVFSVEVKNKKNRHKEGINLTVERTGCFIFGRGAEGLKVQCGHYLIPQRNSVSYRDLYQDAKDVALFAVSGTANTHLNSESEYVAKSINLAEIFGASGCLTPALSWEYLQQRPRTGEKVRTIVSDSFGGCSYFDSWYETRGQAE